MKNSYSDVGASTLPLSDIMLLWNSGGFESADIITMITKAKRTYVDSRHHQAVSQMHCANKYKDGSWKTYVIKKGKRKEVIRKTEEALYDALYTFYREQEAMPKTYANAVDMLMQRKAEELNRSPNTIFDNRRYFAYMNAQIQQKALCDISEKDLRLWLQNEFMPTKPTETALRKMLQLLKELFRYSITMKLCSYNPALYIQFEDYVKDCDLNKKTDEQRAFSAEDLAKLDADARRNLDDPRALMVLLAKETGMRVGEMPALHMDDIKDGFIHVHRQQIRGKKNGHQYFYEVGYTKDERKHPHGGRYVPITPACAEILKLIEHLPGDSEYLFHDKKGNFISKDSYEQNLRRRCKRLGIVTQNNHAFRIAFNSRLIGLGFNPADRALILGHAVETNERNYSVSDNRRRYEILDRLCLADTSQNSESRL